MAPLDLNISRLLQNGAGATGRDELEVVVDQINDVIRQITDEEQAFAPVTFAFGASVSPGSFGGADSSSALSQHYNRAHEVTWKTMQGIKDDLVEFREACRAAMEEISKADDNAADNMRVVTNALGIVATGGQGRRSERAHQDAQQSQDLGDGGGVDS